MKYIGTIKCRKIGSKLISFTSEVIVNTTSKENAKLLINEYIHKVGVYSFEVTPTLDKRTVKPYYYE